MPLKRLPAALHFYCVDSECRKRRSHQPPDAPGTLFTDCTPLPCRVKRAHLNKQQRTKLTENSALISECNSLRKENNSLKRQNEVLRLEAKETAARPNRADRRQQQQNARPVAVPHGSAGAATTTGVRGRGGASGAECETGGAGGLLTYPGSLDEGGSQQSRSIADTASLTVVQAVRVAVFVLPKAVPVRFNVFHVLRIIAAGLVAPCCHPFTIVPSLLYRRREEKKTHTHTMQQKGETCVIETCMFYIITTACGVGKLMLETVTDHGWGYICFAHSRFAFSLGESLTSAPCSQMSPLPWSTADTPTQELF